MRLPSCEHAGALDPDRVVESTLCGERGRRVPIFDCNYHNKPATSRRYAQAQTEAICIACPIMVAKLGADL